MNMDFVRQNPILVFLEENLMGYPNSCLENSERYQILRPYLNVNEQVLWSGNPCTTRKNKTNVFFLVFMIFWTGFSVFWTVTATFAGGAFGLFGIPFLVIGFFTLYQFIIAPKKKIPRTVYAVTNTRAILLIPSKNGYDMTSYLFHSMQGVNLSDMKEDSGSIVFPGRYSVFNEYGYRNPTIGNIHSVAIPTDRFLLIDGVNKVYRLIMDQIEAQK